MTVGDFGARDETQVNSLLVNDEEINGSGGEMEEAVEEEIEVFINIYGGGNFLIFFFIHYIFTFSKH